MKRRMGEGENCPVVREHGPMYMDTDGTMYCPHQSHDGKTPSHYANDGVTPIKRRMGVYKPRG